MNAIAPASVPSHGPQLDNKRVLAGLIDLLVVGIVAAIVLSAAGVLGGEHELTTGLEAVVLGWALFYSFALESGAGQTVGKRLMGLRVTMADGSPADMAAIAKRTVVRVIDGIGFYLVGLIAMRASGERRQRLGDVAAGTIVTSADGHSVASASSAQAAVAPSAPTFEPGAIPPLPVLETPVPAGPETPMPALDVTPTADPMADASPEFSYEAPVEPVIDASPEPVVEAPSEPVVEVTPEPVVEAPSEPVAEVAPDPVVVAPVEPTFGFMPEPAVEATLEPEVEIAEEPEAEAVSEPVVEIESPDEPAAEAAPAMDWGFSHGPAPTAEADSPEASAPEDEPAEDHVKVRSVETVSAIDLVMGELEEDEAAGPATTA